MNARFCAIWVAATDASVAALIASTAEVHRMALDRDTTFTWYGHACVEVRTPGGRVILIDPWFGNPRSPRTADSIAEVRPACSSPTDTTTTSATPSHSPRGCGRPGRASTR